MKHSDTQPSLAIPTEDTLALENLYYRNTAGVSENNRSQGFVPAFLDTATGHVYRSRFQNGQPAPLHVLSGLPHELFERDSSPGSQPAVKRSVMSGFLRKGIFYSREEAAQAAEAGLVH